MLFTSQGVFDLHGSLPPVPANVRLVKGYVPTPSLSIARGSQKVDNNFIRYLHFQQAVQRVPSPVSE